MKIIRYRFEEPLRWPVGQPRTEKPQASRFYRRVNGYQSANWTAVQAAHKVADELRLLGVRSEFLITTEAATTKDGRLHHGRRKPDDAAVSVWFQYGSGNGWHAMAIDAYNRIGCNLWAVAKCIESLRALERHGAPSVLEQAVGGFRKALPAAGVSHASAMESIVRLANNGREHAGHGRDLTELDEKRTLKHWAQMGAHPDQAGAAGDWEECQALLQILGWKG